jgi:hypothetical protein
MYRDYFYQLGATTMKTEVNPGKQEFTANSELYFFNHSTEVLPDGNYSLYYQYGQDSTFYGYIQVINGQYIMSYDRNNYTTYAFADTNEANFGMQFQFAIVCLIYYRYRTSAGDKQIQ